MVVYTPGMPVPTDMKSYIRPEHLPKALFLNPETRVKYQQGIQQLWNRALAAAEASTDRIQACQKLAEVSQQLNRQHAQYRSSQQAAQQSGSQGQPQNQAAQQNAQPSQASQPHSVQPQSQQQPQPQPNPPAARSASQEQPGPPASQGQVQQRRAATVRDELKRLTMGLVPPPSVKPADVPKWLAEQRHLAAQSIKASEQCQNSIAMVQKQVIDRQKLSPLTDADKAKVQAKMVETYAQLNSLSDKMTVLSKSFSQFQRPPGGVVAAQTGTASKAGQEQAVQTQSQPPAKNEPSEAAAVAVSNTPAAASPVTVVPAVQPPQPQAPTSGATRPVPPQVNLALKNEASRPMPQPVQGSAPIALSHQDAVDKARSYQQPSAQTPASAGPHHSHQSLPRADSQTRMPENRGYANQNKTLNVTPLQPVSMAPARPTLTGGAGGAPGMMGQPGLQKHPGYVLEGEGERVLSEKKLEELVREVTGSGGGEGAESLDPEVKETLLDMADEFIDNVVMAACKVAKLRSSSTLELRDIQLILERNYNIRVPGYASDELRTVKKIQPTQSWAQKMSAVQAAKVTGGKTDI